MKLLPNTGTCDFNKQVQVININFQSEKLEFDGLKYYFYIIIENDKQEPFRNYQIEDHD